MNKSEMIFLYVRSKDECVRVSGGQKVLYMENNNKTFEKKKSINPTTYVISVNNIYNCKMLINYM